jgi:hypothetical protein
MPNARQTESRDGHIEGEKIVLGTLHLLLTISTNFLRYLRFIAF